MDWNNIIPITLFITYVLLAWFCYKIGCRSVQPIKTNNAELLIKKKELQDDIEELSQSKIYSMAEKYELEKQRQEIEKQLQIETLSLKNKQQEIQNLEERRSELEDEAQDQAEIFYQNQVTKMNSFFEQDRKKLEQKYDNLLNENEEIEKEIQSTKKELDSLKETRIAAISAAQQEKNISENKDFYCLKLPPQYQGDIEILKNILPKISKPRSILMAIWQTYYQPIAKQKFPQILGKTNVCGIYKITNQETGECYIGQAVDIRKRWMDHCKMMLQIDAPKNNQLYAAAALYGLDSFSFELLLECMPEELNQKEKYFIELYNADAVGYNQVKGNN